MSSLAEHLAEADLHALRAAMDEARVRRLQPHYIEMAFKAAFARLVAASSNASKVATRSRTSPSTYAQPERDQSRPSTTASPSSSQRSTQEARANWLVLTSLDPVTRSMTLCFATCRPPNPRRHSSTVRSK